MGVSRGLLIDSLFWDIKWLDLFWHWDLPRKSANTRMGSSWLSYASVLLFSLVLTPTTFAVTTCSVPHTDNGTDDVPALHALLSRCSSNARILFQQGVTYNIRYAFSKTLNG